GGSGRGRERGRRSRRRRRPGRGRPGADHAGRGGREVLGCRGWGLAVRVAVLYVRVTSRDGTEGPGRKAASLTWVHGARGAAPATRCLIGGPRLRGCGRSV